MRDITQEIKNWKKLKKRYKEEVEVNNDIEMNIWLSENAQKEIDILEKCIKN